MAAPERPAFLLIGGPADILVDGVDGGRLPPPYRTQHRAEPSLNFAGESMRGRIANRILDDIKVDNADWLPQEAANEIGLLQEGLRSLDGVLTAPTAEEEERDHFYLKKDEENAVWDSSMGSWYGKRWRDAPFILGEIYLYRRILATISKSMQTPIAQLPDIFRAQKDKSIRLSLPLMSKLLAELDEGHSPSTEEPALRRRDAFQQHLLASLWANQMDLALYNVAESLTPKQRNLLDDQSDRLYNYLTGLRNADADADAPAEIRLDIVLDNNGMELFCDLVLAVHLLRARIVDRVVLHAKNSAFFVSDTTVDDLPLFLDLVDQAHDASLSTFIGHVRSCLASGQLQVTTHSFWTVAAEFHCMPSDLRSLLADSHLVICKGDLNYRRLLGDRLWHPLTPFSEIVGYFPSHAVAALRTNKSEVVASLHIDSLTDMPVDWLVSGRYAVLHFHQQAPSSR